jgi:hypothetical protein
MMKRVLVGTSARISFLCMMAALMAAPALYGQAAGGSSDEWKFKLAPYLVFPWMDGNVAVRGREVDVNVGAGDILSNLQFGAMGYFEARKGAWGFGADAIYMALGTTIDPDLGRNLPSVDVDFNQGAYQFTGLYALNEKIDLTAGARWNVLSGRLGFKGPQAITVEDTKQWVDPTVGLQIHQPLGGRWNFGLVADIGGFGAASKFAWQVFPTVGINVGKKARIGFGYRALGMNYETGSGDTLFRYDVITSGPVLGMAFNF